MSDAIFDMSLRNLQRINRIEEMIAEQECTSNAL